MKKALYILIFALFAVCSAQNTSAQSSQRYVRQKVQPNFFIPNGALVASKPEKVSVPQYRKGKTTAKRISADDNLYAEKKHAKQKKLKTVSSAPPIQTNETTDSAPLPSTPAPSQIDDGTPNYQKMYQDYLQDLASIAKTGDVSDPSVLTDLDAMNSEKRIELDKNFNQKRDVKKEIQSVLKK